MKILAIGDPHGEIPKNLPKSDLIIIPGDLGKADLARKRFFENKQRKKDGLPEVEETLKYARDVHKEIHDSTVSLVRSLSKLSPVYAIQGNVGIPSSSEVREGLEKYGLKLQNTRRYLDGITNFHLIKNQVRMLGGLRFGFLEYFLDVSWVREFHPDNYQQMLKKARCQTEKAAKILRRFKGLDILVCHQPPYGILDKVSAKFAPASWQGKHAGSKVILNYIKKYQPRYVLCGHIHEAYGEKSVGRSTVLNLGQGRFKLIEI